jgi:hypothetical protein
MHTRLIFRDQFTTILEGTESSVAISNYYCESMLRQTTYAINDFQEKLLC